jgi:hypothetical protein
MGSLVSETDAQLFERMRDTADAHLAHRPARRRVLNWESAFAHLLAVRAQQPFVWGASDCCLFAGDVIYALRGEDPAWWFRGRYTDQRGAARALREYSDGSTLESVAERICAERAYAEIPAAFAQRGDLVLIETDAGDALGVQVDHRVAVQGPAGVIITSDVRVRRAWAI